MKKCSIQFFITISIIVALAGISEQAASAYKVRIKTEKTGPYVEKMGDEMFDVAKGGACHRFKSYWKGVKEDGDVNSDRVFAGMDVTKKDTFTLCKPYVIWCDSESRPLYPLYYFPVAVKGQIVALVKVSGRMEEPEYVGANIIYMDYEEYEQEIEGLNRLDYLHKDYVFFLYGGITMAQSEDGKPVTLRDSVELSRDPTDGEEFFYALDYDKKLELAIAQMDDYMTHEEIMAFSEAHSDPNPVIGGTGSGEGAAQTSKQAATPKPDISTEEDSNSSPYILPVIVTAGVIVVLAVAFTIIRIKKGNNK